MPTGLHPGTPSRPALPGKPAASRLAGLIASLLLCACGLGDAGSSATAAAKLKAQEAEQARAAQVGIASQLDAAQQQAGQRQKDIEAATR